MKRAARLSCSGAGRLSSPFRIFPEASKRCAVRRALAVSWPRPAELEMAAEKAGRPGMRRKNRADAAPRHELGMTVMV